MSAYYVSRETAPVHVWDEDDVEYIAPPPSEGADPFYDPIGETLCGETEPGHEADPMEDHAPSIKAFIQGHPADYICPGCVLALERRHKLPESYRTEALEELIAEWQAAQARQAGPLEGSAARTVLSGSTEADVVETAREMVEDLGRHGKPLEDLTLTVSSDVMDDLRAETFGVAHSETVSLDGVPVIEDFEADSPGEIDAMTFDTVSFDLEVSSDAVDAAVEAAAEEAEQKARARYPLTDGPPDDTEEALDTDAGHELTDAGHDWIAERARVESGYDRRVPAKYLPDHMDAAPVAGEPPRVSGVTKDAGTWCLDCAVTHGWVNFKPEPTQPRVSEIFRDEEWAYIPRCEECERPLDVPSSYSGWDDLSETFAGTCVSQEPVVLDDGHEAVEVKETDHLGEDPRLAQEYEVPLTAVVPADPEDS